MSKLGHVFDTEAIFLDNDGFAKMDNKQKALTAC